MTRIAAPKPPEYLTTRSDLFGEVFNPEPDLSLLYGACTALYLAKRDKMRLLTGEHGGVGHIRNAKLNKNGPYINAVEMKDGTYYYTTDFLLLDIEPVSTVEKKPATHPGTQSQSYDLQGGFCIAVSAERLLMTSSRENHAYNIDDDESLLQKVSRLVLTEDSYIPNEFALVERVTIKSDDRRDINEAAYSLYGDPKSYPDFHPESAPNPFTEPKGYKKWAEMKKIRFNRLDFEAPYPTNLIFTPYKKRLMFGRTNDGFEPDVNLEVAKSRLERFKKLLGYYVQRLYPDGFPSNVGQEKPITGIPKTSF